MAFAGVGVAGAQAPQFAPPVRLQADGKFLGANRLYPSPVFHDVDGDGLQDIVVGDLYGSLTAARRVAGRDAKRHAAENPVTAADGKPLKFHNW